MLLVEWLMSPSSGEDIAPPPIENDDAESECGEVTTSVVNGRWWCGGELSGMGIAAGVPLLINFFPSSSAVDHVGRGSAVGESIRRYTRDRGRCLVMLRGGPECAQQLMTAWPGCETPSPVCVVEGDTR